MSADNAVLGQMIIDFSGWALFSTAAFFVAIIAIVAVHEYGHYIVGRWCGVNVETFSVGFGKELLGFTDRNGTRWKFCAIPLGGYVKFEGDANAASQPSGEPIDHTATSLHAQPLWQRAAIVAAGPLANFLTAIVIFTGIYWTMGMPYVPAEVKGLLAGGAAETAGLKTGDVITKIDGDTVYSFEDISMHVRLRTGDPLEIVVDRQGSPVSFTVVPKAMQFPDGLGGNVTAGGLGISYKSADGQWLIKELSLPGSFVQAVWHTKNQIVMFGRTIKAIVFGKQSTREFGGALTIARLAGTTASYGPSVFIGFIALLSISIGLINLFPVPILDGGHLVFFAIEGILGKPLEPKAQEWSFRVGFALIIALIAMVQINDITRYFGLNFGT